MSIRSPSPLLSSCRSHNEVRRLLLQEFPDLDDETLADTLEGLTDLQDMLSELIRSMLDDQALLAGIAVRLKDMKARQARLAIRIDKKRALALRCLREVNLMRLTQPDYTAFVRTASPTLEILNEIDVPAAFWKPQPALLNRQALLSALKRGEKIAGASLSAPGLQLSVRTR